MLEELAVVILEILSIVALVAVIAGIIVAPIPTLAILVLWLVLFD